MHCVYLFSSTSGNMRQWIDKNVKRHSNQREFKCNFNCVIYRYISLSRNAWHCNWNVNIYRFDIRMHEFSFDGSSDWCMRAIHIVCLFNSLAFLKLSCASVQLLKSNTQKLHTGSSSRSSRSSNRSDWNNNKCSKRNNGDNCHAIDGTLSLHTLTLISHFFH